MITYQYAFALKAINNINSLKFIIMSKLSEDLDRYCDEVYYRRDIKAGIKLIVEITGLISIGTLLCSALFVWLPGIGIPITTFAAVRFIQAATEAYINLDEGERKKVRAVVRWVKGGISLVD